MVLSHFKGHAMGGFGGALKNISIGVASSHGKGLIHSGGDITPRPEGADRQQPLSSAWPKLLTRSRITLTTVRA